MNNEHKDLQQFACRFRDGGQAYGYLPESVNSYKIQDITGITWYRDKNFQIELFIVPQGKPPNYTIVPQHTHPNVASYDMYLGGDAYFSLHGLWANPGTKTFHENTIVQSNHGDIRDIQGSLLYVAPNAWHGACWGSRGGAFMSIQKWLHGVEPHSVANDYTGKVMGDNHYNQVVDGDAIETVKKELTWKDVADKEIQGPGFFQNYPNDVTTINYNIHRNDNA